MKKEDIDILDRSAIDFIEVPAPSKGQKETYVVLNEVERKKGYIRPVRRDYIHKYCNTVTVVPMAIAETWARDPKFYGRTFCCNCQTHFSVSEFKWVGTDEVVGS